LVKAFREWQEEIRNKKNTEFYQQYLETEKINSIEREKKTRELLTKLYERYKGKTIEIKPEEKQKIQQIKDELYLEFCQKHNYEEESKEAKEKFNKLLAKVNNINYTVHPSAIYTSRLLDFKNLPEPQNCKEINEQFYSKSKDSLLGDSKQADELDINKYLDGFKEQKNQEEISIKTEQKQEQQPQILQITNNPSKGGNS